jgi:DNA-binding SARP family transcriptional activator
LPTAAAQNNLRVTWAQLQKALRTNNSDAQPHLIGERLTVRFNPLSDHELDVARFGPLIEECRSHPHADPDTCADCAARLTSGDFFSLGPSNVNLFLFFQKDGGRD